ncbi:uracil-xanthine permease family protein [Streptomyces sp. NPDC127098]|uniref:uracil-xanthine permease family protein n=1 Tax=Streptomyces sp. NPDC127098 TaxID=3347137 RepID=UPI00364A16BB
MVSDNASDNAPTHGVLRVGFEDRLPPGRTTLFGIQHLLALTGIWIFPAALGSALSLSQGDVGRIVQACFLLTGIVTVLQSGRMLRLPIVQGPTAAFLVALIAAGGSEGLGTAFGSMMVAGVIFMALTIPARRLGLFGHIARIATSPLVFGTLFVVIGAQLAGIGVSGWFGAPGTEGFGGPNFAVACVTVLTVLACLVFGGRGLVKHGAIVWGIVVGSLTAAATGLWSVPDLSGSGAVAAPEYLPFGFGVSWPVVLLMVMAFLQAGTEAMGMYSLVGGWGGQRMTLDRTNRGLFAEFLGSTVGAAFGGIGTTSYPENAAIVRVTGIGSRFVTMTAGGFAIVLAFVPPVGLFIAGLPGPVLSAASTVLFGIIAMSGVQLLSTVRWDDLNLAVAAPAFIIALGVQFLPPEITESLPDSAASILTSPMMVAVILLLVLHLLVNILLRPALERRAATATDEATTPAPAAH